MQVTLAEALLRRKELGQKVDQLRSVKNADVYTVIAKRVQVSEGLDDLTAKVPKLTVSEVTAEYDFYARQLRLVDAVIQQTNWTTNIEVADMNDYVAPASN